MTRKTLLLFVLDLVPAIVLTLVMTLLAAAVLCGRGR